MERRVWTRNVMKEGFMDNLLQSRVASVLTAGVGVWLLLSPLFITLTGGALVSVLAAGAVIAVAGAVQLFWENTLPSWVTGLAALWLLAAIVIFGVTGAALWSQAIAAVGAILLAGWDGLEVEQLQHHHSGA